MKIFLWILVSCVIIAEDITKPMMFDSQVRSGYTDITVKIKAPSVILENGKVSTRSSVSTEKK
jgi:hypothetical protein